MQQWYPEAEHFESLAQLQVSFSLSRLNKQFIKHCFGGLDADVRL